LSDGKKDFLTNETTSRRQPPQPKSPHNEELRKRKIEYKKKMMRRIFIKRLLFNSLVFLVLYAFIFGIYAFSKYISFISVGDSSSPSYTYYLEDTNGKTTKLLQLYENDTHYICADFLADLEKVTIAGDLYVRSIVLKDSSQWTDFYAESEKACINGTFICSSSPFLIRDYKLYLPVSFLEDYANGLTFTYKGNNCNVSYTSPFSFKVKADPVCPPLHFPD